MIKIYIIDIIDFVEIMDKTFIIDFMHIMHILEIIDIMDIINKTAWMAMACAVLALIFFFPTGFNNKSKDYKYKYESTSPERRNIARNQSTTPQFCP